MAKRQTKPNFEPVFDPPSGNRSRRGNWIRWTLLALIVVSIGAVIRMTPLRDTLRWASTSRPTPQQQHADLETALDHVYRAFELEDETATYDQIAQSVTGDAIREIYLEVRKSLSDDEGGQISIDRVRVDSVDQIRWRPDGGCRVDAAWAVGGTVGHFGHEHERENRYRASITLQRQTSAWKISSIEITEQERER